MVGWTLTGNLMSIHIGPFVIQETLAVGGSAIVYKALDMRDGVFVALKNVQGDLIHQKNAYRRFMKEAEILST